MTIGTTTAATTTMMAATTTEGGLAHSADVDASKPSAGRRQPWRVAFLGLRTRIVVGFAVLMAIAAMLSVVILRQVLLVRLDERVNEHLVQEVTELRQLVGGRYPDGTCVTDLDGDGSCDVGRDPETGEPFGDDIEALFRTFLRRNVPFEHEALLAFVDGEPFRPYEDAPLHPLFDEERIRRLGAVNDAPLRGRVDVDPVGAVQYLAVPVAGASGETLGVFAVAEFVDLQRADVDEATRAAAVAGICAVLVASVFAFLMAGRILAPVRTLSRTVGSISDGDFSQRIRVEGRDEISDLARRFNVMLDHIEDAFGAQRTFVDDAGHELRTPITIIRGHLELLGDDPQERAETVAVVTDELDRMSRMVDDLLTLAKAERPDFLALDTVDIEDLTVDLHAKASALAKREWRLECVGSGEVVADRQRLTQAVMQLAQNAVQHTCDGDRIGLGTRVRDGVACMWVRDAGPGVRPEDAARIFGRFARAAGSRRRSEGAGLGLSIVRAIAEAHGGTVELDSRPGNGAIFTLTVPVNAEPDAGQEVRRP